MRGFLDRLFGPTAPSPEAAEGLAALERLARDRPALAAPAAVLARLLPGLCPSTNDVVSFSLSLEMAKMKLSGGVPLLRGEADAVDIKALRRRWDEVAAVLGDDLKDAVRSGRWNLAEQVASAFAGRPSDARTTTALHLALFPLLTPLAEGLAPLREGVPWNRGYCPTCGCWPLLGEFRGLEQDRWLRCGVCATGWPFPRLACPFCDNRDHEQLSYFHVEGEQDRNRASVCGVCRGYVKGVATLGPLSKAMLLVADLETLHLDLIAASRSDDSGP